MAPSLVAWGLKQLYDWNLWFIGQLQKAITCPFYGGGILSLHSGTRRLPLPLPERENTIWYHYLGYKEAEYVNKSKEAEVYNILF